MIQRFRFLHPICFGALVLALAYIAWDSGLRVRWADRVTAVRGVWTDPPREEVQSPTGYDLGRRNLVLPYEASDGYHWIMQTQQMFAKSELRVRHVNYDNAPHGREVHWASPFRWWIGALAQLHHRFTGTPLPISVERAALYANPLLLALALLVLVPLIAQRFGPVAAGIFALLSVGVGPYYGYFVAAQPDHHGLAVLCALTSVLCLVAGGGGWIRQDGASDLARASSPPPGSSPGRGTASNAQMRLRDDARELAPWLCTEAKARRWFMAAAIAGGVGMWVSAASQILVLAGIGLAALIAAPRATGGSVAYESRLWRIWGIAGALTCVFSYLVEYFPAHLGWRFEVNHPLYAVAWLAAAEMIQLWSRRRLSGTWVANDRDKAWGAGAIIGLAVPLLVVLITRADTFWVADPFLLELHQKYIEEFRPLLSALSRNLSFFTPLLCLPLAALVPCLVWAKREAKASPTATLLVLASVPGCTLVVFALKQYRWLGAASALALVAFALLAFLVFERRLRPRMRWWLLLLVLLSASAAPIRSVITWGKGEFQTTYDVYQIALRDLASWLRVRSGASPCVVATSPTISSVMAYHGGLQSLGTYYWENLPGLRASADFFSATTAEQALHVVRERGITHIVMVSWDDFAAEYTQLTKSAERLGAGNPQEPFCVRLVRTKAMPPWLRLVPYKFPAVGALRDQAVFIFEVVAPQALDQTLAGSVNYLVDIDELGSATKFLPVLDRFPESLQVAVARARVEQRTDQKAALQRTLQRIRSEIARGAELPVEDTLHLGALFVGQGDVASARACFEQSISRLDEKTIRKLSSTALAELLYHAPRLGADSPPQNLLKLAFEVLPPRLREQLRASAGTPE